MTTVLLSRAAQSWRIEGPRGFSKRAIKYVLRLGRPAIGEPIGAYAPRAVLEVSQPFAPDIGKLGEVYGRREAGPAEAEIDVPATPPAGGLYGPVQADLPRVDDLLRSLLPADFEFLSGTVDHLLQAGGKRARPALTLLAGRMGRYDLELLVPLAASIELLHTATLVHDDVIDAAPTRRGRATANALVGNAASVMVGDYMFAHAAELVARTGDIEVIRLFARTLMEMATGELKQDISAYAYSQSLRDYFNRIYGKTASLFATSAQGGAMVAGLSAVQAMAMRAYGENLGMAFQVVDDILDFTGDEAELGKPAGSDLMQGTLTLPALMLIERDPDDNPVKRLFDGQRKAENLRRALKQVRESDIVDRCYAVAYDFRDKALRALESEPLAALDSYAAAQARKTLSQLAHWVTERRS